jgi:uncharacterized membrane protein
MHYVFLALLFALLIGIVAGLRAMTPLAVLAWGTLLGWLNLDGTWAAWIGSIIAVVIFSILAVGELITDQLPKTPSRKSTPQFATRLVIGGLAGAIIGTPFGHIYSAIGAGIIGAVLGTLGGYEARKRLVAADGGHDLPIALLEDAVAVLGGFVIVYAAGLM